MRELGGGAVGAGGRARVADAIYGHTGPRCFGEDGRHLAMFPGRDAIVHLTPEVNDTVYRDSAIVDLRPGWREPLALTNRKLIRLHQDSAVPIPLDREISVHPAVVAETARYLWVGGSDTTGFAVELFAKHEGGHGASFTRSFSLPAPALLAASATSEDELIAVLLDAPYSIVSVAASSIETPD